MLDYIYEWIRNIAFYLVLITAVVHMMPDSDYKKYIRFFTGLVLILLVLTPVLKVFRMEDKITDLYKSREYVEQMEKMKDSAEYFRREEGRLSGKAKEQPSSTGEKGGEKEVEREVKIEVEEIRIEE